MQPSFCFRKEGVVLAFDDKNIVAELQSANLRGTVHGVARNILDRMRAEPRKTSHYISLYTACKNMDSGVENGV